MEIFERVKSFWTLYEPSFFVTYHQHGRNFYIELFIQILFTM